MANKGVPYGDDFGTASTLGHLSITPLSRPGPSISAVNFHGEAPHPLLQSLCEVDWDINVIIDTTVPAAPQATVVGWHNGMPGYEIYIDGQPAYQWLPPFGRGLGHYCLQDRQPIAMGPFPLW